jgi:uncharacterized protein YukE
MNDSQLLTIALAAVPNMLIILVSILNNNSRLSGTNSRIDRLHSQMDRRFDGLQGEMNRRFGDTRDMWRSELHRVEEILTRG